MSACQECGLPHQPGQRFCTGCGAQAGAAGPGPVSAPTPVEGTVDYRNPGAWASPGPVPSPPPASASAQVSHPGSPPAPPPGARGAAPPGGGGGHRTALTVGLVLTVVAVLAVVALMVQVLVLADEEGEPGIASGSTSASEGEGPGVAAAGGSGGIDGAASCPVNSNTPDIRRWWRDGSGIHVVVVIQTTCDQDQVFADDDARFSFSNGPARYATASFDLSSRPVAIPGGGSSGEIELVFDGEAGVDAAALAAIQVPESKEAAVDVGLTITYEFSCQVTATLPPSSDAVVDAASGDAPAGTETVEDSAPPPATVDLSGDAALRELERIADADRPVVDGSLVDRWVSQLSSKRLGITDGTTGIYYGDHGQVLDNYQQLLDRYPDLRLLRSGDFSSFEDPGFWVMVRGVAYGSAEEANRWCDGEGWGVDDCFAKLIGQGSSEGTTVLRG